MVQDNKVQYRAVQFSTENTVQCSTVHLYFLCYITRVSCTISWYSTVQHSTVQYSIVMLYCPVL